MHLLIIQFLRPNLFEGNFYEAVFLTAKRMLENPDK